MTEPTEWALREAHKLQDSYTLDTWSEFGVHVALALDAAWRQGIEEAAASHERSGGNPAFRKMEADAIRALIDKGP